jgi:glycylpeptide N-tetradecanoyltransferase
MEDKKEEPKKEEEEKKEEPKKEEEKKENPPKKVEKKEEPKNNNDTLTTSEQRNFIDQVLKYELDNIKPKHSKSEIKESYPFWETQPVLQFNKESEVKFGEIWKDHKVEELPKEPYALPEEGLEWKDVDMTKQNEIDKLYEFLKNNYVEDEDHMFRFDYSKDFLKWHLTSPNYCTDWLISIVQLDTKKNKKKMVGFIAGIPIKVCIHGYDIELAEVDFLCVKKEFRNKRLAPLLIKEVSRRIHLRDKWWAVYTSGTMLPKPFAETTYYHRNLNVKKLVDVHFTYLPHNMNMARAKNLYKLPTELPFDGFRPMQEKDVDQVYVLLENFEKQFKVHGYYDKALVKHWFLPRKQVVYSYVRENKEKVITDFISFYSLPSSILQHENYKKLMAAYSFFNINTTLSVKEIMKCALILAKNEGFDVFNCLNIMHNEEAFTDLLFGKGGGKLKYYFWNFVCPYTEPKDLSLVLM